MLKNPFKAKEVRTPLYLWGSCIIALMVTTILFVTAKRSDNYDYLITGWIPFIAIMTIFVSYFFIAIFSIFYAFKKVCKPGISKETQKLVLVRHIISIICFMISQTYLISSIIYVAIPPYKRDREGFQIVYVFKILFISQGIYMPILRASEPFFFDVIR
jgi:hypothetical protein